MSGAIIIRTLLAASVPLIAVVPATRIMAGVLPVGTVKPAIGITTISSVVVGRAVKMATTGNLWQERVQVTIEAVTYTQKKSILTLVRAALPSTRGAVGAYTCDSISVDIEGPDIFDADTDTYVGSQDFAVRYVR